MVGDACERTGADIFFQTAVAIPEHDFLWVGRWAPAEIEGNLAYGEFSQLRIANFFVAEGLDNPYRFISEFDLFF